MPSEQYKPKRGDKYAVFHVALPQAYIADNATKTGAEWEMLKKAVRHLYENEDQKYTFTGELDGLWAKHDWPNIGGRLVLGGYVSFRDDSFARDGVLLRIVGIKDFVNAPHSPILELSNDVVGSSFSGGLQKLRDDEVMVEERHKEALQFTKRRFSDAKRTTEALIEAALDGFTGKVSPIVVQTMQLLVGDESLQFRFIDNRANPKQAAHNITFKKETRQLIIPSGTIQHLTMGITTLSSRHAPSEYKYWDIQGITSARLDEADKSYYIYARVEANGTRGTFRIEEQSRRIDSEAGAYWLLLGLLNAETDGERSFVAMYGYSEVLPGQIRTDKIATPDGAAYFDLNSGVIASKSIRFVYPDGSLHDYPNDYLHTAIKEGSTEISGGLVLGSIIGAKNNAGAVASYLSGVANLPAFAAGVTDFGKPNEARVVAINHDGTGHWGQMEVMEGGKVLQIGSMRFGGKLPNTYTQDLRTLEFNDPRHERSRTYIGEDGALFFFGMFGATPRFVRISNQLNKPVLQVRGDVDISGSLLGGRVSAGNVSFEHKWGARADRMSIRRKETGIYIVTHDLGHTRYSVLCMDAGNGRHNAKAGKIRDNSFEIYTKYDNTLYSDIDFTFYVFGDNY